MRKILRHSLLTIALIANMQFVACTGGTKTSPSDAEGFSGNKPRNFYHLGSASQIDGVSINDDKKSASRFSINSSTLVLSGDIAYDSVHLSVDGAYLTIQGTDQIYEFNSTPPEKVAQPGFTLPAASIDTLCVSSAGPGVLLGSTGFSEVRAYISNGGYHLVGVGPNGALPLIANDAAATRNDSRTEMTYLANGKGLHIREQNRSAFDPAYYSSTIDAEISSSTDWTSATNLVCHLNLPVGETPIVVQTPSPTPLVVTDHHLLFITSASFPGGFGGLAFADAFCTARAAVFSRAQGLKGTWRAIMSDATNAARDRILLTPGIPVYNSNGETLVYSAPSLWGGTLITPIRYDETGYVGSGSNLIWTGSNGDGSVYTDQIPAVSNCNSWTAPLQNSSSLGMGGIVGNAFATDSQWIQSSFSFCSAGALTITYSAHFYCINSNK